MTTEFDVEALARYLGRWGLIKRGSKINEITKFSHGQSNPTYLLTASNSKTMVLRKQPPGALLSKAHQVDREARVMNSFAIDGRVPVPRIFVVESDTNVIGTKFYVMEFVQGVIYRSPSMPGESPLRKRLVYEGLARVLANIHTTDADSVMAAIGSTIPDDITTKSFCLRQVKLWGEQYRQSVVNGERFASMDLLGAWLQQNAPEDKPGVKCPVSFLHGDFRLDNVIFSEDDDAKIKAVLDWELSSVGNPVADLAYCCLGYYLPPTGFLSSFSLFTQDPTSSERGAGVSEGIPSVAQFVECYRRELVSSGGTFVVPRVDSKEWCYYLSLGLFRIGAICGGVYARAVQGNASSGPQALMFREAVPLLATTALGLIESMTGESVENSKRSGSDNGGNRSSSSGNEIEWEGASDACQGLLRRLRAFLDEEVIPAEQTLTNHSLQSTGVWPQRGDRWIIPSTKHELAEKAKERGLWNLWLTDHMAKSLRRAHPQWPWEQILPHKTGLSHEDYAFIAIETGRSLYGAEAVNCMAPDTGNMEILALFATAEQQERWLLPLLLQQTRSCFGMTEPHVASSDPTQLSSTAVKVEEGAYVINGKKWWTTGACDERCAVCIFVATTATRGPAHERHSFFLVPMDAPGVTVVRPLTVFGYDDAPHGHAETSFEGVRVGAEALLGKEGQGFLLAQNRLGPGRLHHCARLVGHSERALHEVVRRGSSRKAFGKSLLELGANEETLARCRVALNQAKLSVMAAARELDLREKQTTPKLRPRALEALAVCKIAAPKAAEQCLDFAVQIHGGGGLSSDHPLAAMWAAARTLRLVDGPDEVHLRTLSRMEQRKYEKRQRAQPGVGKPRL